MDKSTAVQDFILHHIADNFQEWHLPFGIHIPMSESFSLHAAMVVLCAVFCIIIFCVIYDKSEVVPKGFTNLLEMFIIFIRDEVSITCFGEEEGRKMTPLFCTMFFFILGLNIMGLIPLFSTATANINVTGATESFKQ